MLVELKDLNNIQWNARTAKEVISRINRLLNEAGDIAFDNEDYKVFGLCRGAVHELMKAKDKVTYLYEQLTSLINGMRGANDE